MSNEALPLAWDAVERFPEDAYAWNELGQVLRRTGQLGEAEQVLHDAIQRFPGSGVAPIGLASLLRLQNRTHEALELCEAVLRRGIERYRTDALAEKGRILEQMQRPEAAQETFEKVRRPSGRPPDRRERAAMVSEARFLRRWARSVESAGAGPSPEELRSRAEGLLEEAIQTCPHDVRALTERALLLADLERYAETRDLLSGALSDFPAGSGLDYAMARVEREQARRDGRPFDEEALRSLVDPLYAMASLNPAYYPLTGLGEGRAYLALTNGQAVRDGAVRSFSRLAKWIRRRLPGRGDEKGFDSWWSESVSRAVFEGSHIDKDLSERDVDIISDNLSRNACWVDVLEEDLTNRLVCRVT